MVTGVIQDTPSPVWRETFHVAVKKAHLGHHKLWVYVKDKRLIGGKEIGARGWGGGVGRDDAAGATF